MYHFIVVFTYLFTGVNSVDKIFNTSINIITKIYGYLLNTIKLTNAEI